MAEETLAERLRRMAANLGHPELDPDDEGLCGKATPGGAMVTLHVDEVSGLLTLFSEIGAVGNVNVGATYDMLLDANFMWSDTEGATLSVDPSSDAIILARCLPFHELDTVAFETLLGDFSRLVDRWRERLDDWHADNAESEAESVTDIVPPPSALA